MCQGRSLSRDDLRKVVLWGVTEKSIMSLSFGPFFFWGLAVNIRVALSLDASIDAEYSMCSRDDVTNDPAPSGVIGGAASVGLRGAASVSVV